MPNFWTTLSKPFLILAPMEDVTDYAFRELVSELPRPHVFFTEFTSATALCSPGRKKVITKFKFSENQRPIVAQIWGTEPDYLYKAAQTVEELGFDGIDINMGCPDKAVMKQGAGASLIKNPTLTKEIISAVKDGAKSLPLSIKTRLGVNKIITEEWLSFLLKQDIQALTVHGRIATQMSKGDANWEEIGKAVQLKESLSPKTVIIGNGDIKSYSQAIAMHKKYHIDGVMIGRGIFANPWVFSTEEKPHAPKEYLTLLQRHLNLFDETWGDTKHFDIMKKFFKMYVNNFYGANELRQQLMECKTKKQVLEILHTIE